MGLAMPAAFDAVVCRLENRLRADHASLREDANPVLVGLRGGSLASGRLPQVLGQYGFLPATSNLSITPGNDAAERIRRAPVAPPGLRVLSPSGHHTAPPPAYAGSAAAAFLAAVSSPLRRISSARRGI
jgi:hypothetical protein